jgi:hypothetical protein
LQRRLVAGQGQRAGRAGVELLESLGQSLRVAEFVGDVLREGLDDLLGAQAVEPDRIGEVVLDGFQFCRVGFFNNGMMVVVFMMVAGFVSARRNCRGCFRADRDAAGSRRGWSCRWARTMRCTPAQR